MECSAISGSAQATDNTILTKALLIVDDNLINRQILTKMLLDSFVVLQAENGLAALELLKTHSACIAAILLDLKMPVMDGYEFLKEISQVENYRSIPVIITTGDTNKESEYRALELGAWDFITKPYDARVLKFRLKNAIARSELSAFQQLKYLSEYDTLTGIYNKDKFFKETQKMLRSQSHGKFICIRADIERFSLINSYFGVREGDRLLQYIAQNIHKFAKEYANCTYGRIESDVFGLCLVYTDLDRVGEIIEQKSAELQGYNINFNIKPSFGLYVVEDFSMPVDAMFDKANLASKRCKGNYMTNYVVYNDAMGRNLTQEQEIINAMKNALAQKQFVIYLQPKYSLFSNAYVGAEALVRWQHPQKGMILPGEFIPVFERNGFIGKLDHYVWEQACILLSKRIHEGKRVCPVSVNVSRVNIYNPHFTRIICDLVEKYQLPPKLLHLELTESAYTDDPRQLKATMDYLHSKGFIIEMDDFGSGYSSLNMLKDLTVDVLKLDMRFLSETEIPNRGQNILASVVRMAKWLGIPTVVEGVEKKEQVMFLHSIGCEYVQGYYFAKPMPEDQYEAFLDS